VPLWELNRKGLTLNQNMKSQEQTLQPKYKPQMPHLNNLTIILEKSSVLLSWMAPTAQMELPKPMQRPSIQEVTQTAWKTAE
jgi:hypothetical protein